MKAARLAGLALVGALAALLALNVAWLARGGDPDGPTHKTVIPDVALPLLDGGELRTGALAGQPTVLAFWATWCPPCVAEIPTLDALARREAPRGVRLYAVSLDEGSADEARATVRGFLAAHPLAMPVALDLGRLADAVDVHQIPQTLVLDARGRVAKILSGPHDLDEMAAAVDDVAAR